MEKSKVKLTQSDSWQQNLWTCQTPIIITIFVYLVRVERESK